MIRVVALSTKDNPFNPITQFSKWIQFDKLAGYSCCEYVARLANYSNFMSEEEKDLETERVIDDIVASDPMENYIKVVAYTDDPEYGIRPAS